MVSIRLSGVEAGRQRFAQAEWAAARDAFAAALGRGIGGLPHPGPVVEARDLPLPLRVSAAIPRPGDAGLPIAEFSSCGGGFCLLHRPSL